MRDFFFYLSLTTIEEEITHYRSTKILMTNAINLKILIALNYLNKNLKILVGHTLSFSMAHLHPHVPIHAMVCVGPWLVGDGHPAAFGSVVGPVGWS